MTWSGRCVKVPPAVRVADFVPVRRIQRQDKDEAPTMFSLETDERERASGARLVPPTLSPVPSDREDMGVAAGCRWLAALLARLDEVLLRRAPTVTELGELDRLCHGHPFIHLVPRSAPEYAEPLDLHRLPESGVLARLAGLWLVTSVGETDIVAGASGQLRLRRRVRYALPDDSGRFTPEADPILVMAVVADLATLPLPPRVATCLLCYDDARIEPTRSLRRP